jgi:hypothetical protein
VSCENIARNDVRVRSCPTNFVRAASVLVHHLQTSLASGHAAYLEVEVPNVVCKFALFGQLSESLSCLSEAAQLLMSQRRV